MSNIHPTAIVAAGARLGEGCSIGPYCLVSAGSVLGDGVELAANVILDGEVLLGPGVKVMPFATIGLPPQDLKYRGQPTRVEIGARTLVREHVTIHRGSVGGHGVTRIGADCLLMCVAHVGHDCDLGDRVILTNNVMLAGHVTIGDTVFIGGGSGVHQFVRIGRQAIIGAGTGVFADVIPFGSVLGARGRIVGLNLIGLKRRGFARPQIHTLRIAFRNMFKGAGVFEERLAQVELESGADPLVAEIVAFIRAESRRGLCQVGREIVEDDENGEAA